jgi:hypothetical protein
MNTENFPQEILVQYTWLRLFGRYQFLILNTASLKGLSHEIEIVCGWYGCVDLYLERCHWRFINFLVAPSIFNIKFSQRSCNSLWIVKSIVATTCKPFQKGIHYPAETFQKATHYPLANSKGRWIASCNKPNLHAALHYLFTILRNVSTILWKW